MENSPKDNDFAFAPITMALLQCLETLRHTTHFVPLEKTLILLSLWFNFPSPTSPEHEKRCKHQVFSQYSKNFRAEKWWLSAQKYYEQQHNHHSKATSRKIKLKKPPKPFSWVTSFYGAARKLAPDHFPHDILSVYQVEHGVSQIERFSQCATPPISLLFVICLSGPEADLAVMETIQL